MRLNINLASQKYEDARAFHARWGTALGLLLVITVALAWFAWSYHSQSVKAGRRIADLQKNIAELDREKSAAEATLNLSENHDVREQSRFWNNRIFQRSFSWTQLFSDLEKVMPNRAYVMSVEPMPSSAKSFRLKFIVAGETHDDANELVKKMEGSARFRAATITREGTQTPTKGGPSSWQFDIEANYLPPPPTAAKEGKP